MFLEQTLSLYGGTLRSARRCYARTLEQVDAETSRLRYLVAGVGIERWRQRPGALGECLGRWPEAVGRWARRTGELRISDEAFRAQYESLDQRITEALAE